MIAGSPWRDRVHRAAAGILRLGRAGSLPLACLLLPVRGHAGPAAPPPTWVSLAPEDFRDRHGYTLVLDDTRRRLVLFGGSDGSAHQGDVYTFELEGTRSWKRLATQGSTPPGRSWAIAVYDSKQDRMLMNGGNNSLRSFDDLWSLSFATKPPTWSRIEIPGAGIPTNAQHAAVYCPDRMEWVIVGGSTPERVSNKVWVLSLGGAPAWRLVPRRGDQVPAPRRWHLLVHDPARDRFVLFGGANAGDGTFGDAWTLEVGDSATWHLVKVATPDSLLMRGPLGVWDPATRSLLVVRGALNRAAGWRLRPFDGTPWERVPLEGDPPGSVGWDAMGVTDPATGRLYALAESGLGCHETWSFTLGDTCRMSRLASGTLAPPPMGRAQVFHDARRGRLVAYAGGVRWSWDLSGGGRWSEIPSEGGAPSPRYGVGAVYDPAADRMIVFGGSNGSDRAFDDLWIGTFDDDRIKWTQVGPLDPAPSGRNGHTMVLDTRRRRAILFGGERGGCCRRNDTWALDLAGPLAWTRLDPRPGTGYYGAPGPTSYHHAVYDSVGDRMIMAGGIWQWGGHGTFELRFSDLTWQTIGGEYKSPVGYSGGMVLDAERHRLVSIEPGDASGRLDKVSTLDLADPAAEWTRIETSGEAPAAGRISFLAFQPGQDAALGYTGSGVPGRWMLQFHEAAVTTLDAPAPSEAARLSVRCRPCLGRELRLGIRLPEAEQAQLEILDLAGRRLWTRFWAPEKGGDLDVAVPEGGVWAPGIYFARLRYGAREEAARIVILK